MSERASRRRGFLGLGLAAAFALAPARATERLSDPTRPPDAARAVAAPAPAAADETLALSAIFHADDRRVAVINGVRVREAGTIGGARILAIETDRVRLRRGEEIIELELVSPAFKNARRADAPAKTPDPRGDSK